MNIRLQDNGMLKQEKERLLFNPDFPEQKEEFNFLRLITKTYSAGKNYIEILRHPDSTLTD